MRPLILIGIMLAIVSGVTLGAALFRDRHSNDPVHASVRNAELFNRILDQVRANYYEELSEAELLDGAFGGVMATLDEHSKYLNEGAVLDLEEDTLGRFGGIGVEVGFINRALRVIRPIPNTPAHGAGVLAGDLIVGVDDYRAEDGVLGDILERLRGRPGTQVTLHLEREGEAVDVELERAVIQLSSVRTRELEPGYGYLRISQFRQDTHAELMDGIAKLNQSAPLQGLVLDLRNNPGGLLRSSIEVADTFIEAGEIVSTRGRQGDELHYTATPGDALNGAALTVLINSGSASAAEIVAGALQDHGRAELLGSRSYGKGTVQTVMPVTANRAIKLTTALYYTPAGRVIQSSGIKPDIEITPPQGKSYEETLLTTALKRLKDSQS